jgi:hypothetical protein
VAVPYTNAVSVVANYGESLAGKILVDISNPFDADASGLVTTTGNSAAQEITAAVPKGTQIVKALNSIFGRRPCSCPPLVGIAYALGPTAGMSLPTEPGRRGARSFAAPADLSRAAPAPPWDTRGSATRSAGTRGKIRIYTRPVWSYGDSNPARARLPAANASAL